MPKTLPDQSLRHIDYISDKKTKRGHNYYLVKYRNSDAEKWEAESNILRECENTDCIERYEKMLNAYSV